MNNYLQAFWNFITSRNLAIVLLIIVTAMLAIGAFLPNPVFLSEEQKLEMHFKNPTLYWLGERYNSQTLASGKEFFLYSRRPFAVLTGLLQRGGQKKARFSPSLFQQLKKVR
jgi:hypothetical protein